jgi:hypothetical protein
MSKSNIIKQDIKNNILNITDLLKQNINNRDEDSVKYFVSKFLTAIRNPLVVGNSTIIFFGLAGANRIPENEEATVRKYGINVGIRLWKWFGRIANTLIGYALWRFTSIAALYALLNLGFLFIYKTINPLLNIVSEKIGVGGQVKSWQEGTLWYFGKPIVYGYALYYIFTAVLPYLTAYLPIMTYILPCIGLGFDLGYSMKGRLCGIYNGCKEIYSVIKSCVVAKEENTPDPYGELASSIDVFVDEVEIYAEENALPLSIML